MRKLILSILIFASLMIASCKKNTAQNETVPNLSFEYMDKRNLSDVISDVEYICLETNEHCLIGSVKQILIYRDKYYILDAPSGKIIYIFDKNGKYLNKIDRHGQGPGEYVMPLQIAINETFNKLYVIDVMQNKMLIYDAENLAFIDEYNLNVEASYFCLKNKNEDIAWYNPANIVYDGKNLPYHVIITDKNHSLVKEMISVEFSSGYSLRPQSPFFQSGNTILFSDPYKGIVYDLSGDDQKILFNIDFQKHKYPPADYLEDIKRNGNFVNEIRQSDYINYFETFESENHYCFNLYANQTYFMAIHDKRTNKNIYFPVNAVKNNSLENRIIDDMGILFFNNPYYCNNNTYYSLINPYLILDKKENHPGNIHPQLQEVINGIKKDSNPILLKYKLK